MKKFNFHLCPNCFPGFEQNVFWEMAAKTPVRRISLSAGADSVRALVPEFMADVPLGGKWKHSLPDLKARLAEFGLEATGIGVAGNLGYPGTERLLKGRIDFAVRMGIPVLNAACTPELDETGKRTAYPLLREAGEYAKERGVKLVLETFGGLTLNAEECLRTLEAIGLPEIGINYDTANVLRFCPELRDSCLLIEDMRRLKNRLGAMHLKDFDAETEEIVALGDGLIDFAALFQALEEMEFDGPVGLDLETTAACRLNSAEAHLKQLMRSLDHLRSLQRI